MADIEKVLEGLKCCMINDLDVCRACPYTVENSSICDRDLLLKESFELLQSQQPRMMTLEEVRENHDVVYLEDLYPNSKIMRGPYLIDHNESDEEQCIIVISYEEAHVRFYCNYGKNGAAGHPDRQMSRGRRHRGKAKTMPVLWE